MTHVFTLFFALLRRRSSSPVWPDPTQEALLAASLGTFSLQADEPLCSFQTSISVRLISSSSCACSTRNW